MDFLAPVWNTLNKINKPVHFLLVGAVWIFAAPAEWSWIGYVAVAFGLAAASSGYAAGYGSAGVTR